MGKYDYQPTYSYMKAKTQNMIREDFYFSSLLLADEMMFTYDNLPESISPKFLEDYLNISRSAGIVGDGSGGYLVCPNPSRSAMPDLDQYGDGMHLEGCTMNGKMLSGTIGKDAVIIYNNTARGRQWDIMTDATAFSDIDKSAAINVIFARYAPLYTAPNDTIKTAMKQVIENVIAGNPDIVVSENVFAALGAGQSDGVKQLEITRPEKIQYIQYLSRYYDDIMKRHFSRRGLSIRTGSKAAQQSVEEINGLDSVSWYMPLNKLKARQEGFKVFNRIFNENVVVRFSEIWQQEYDAYILRLMKEDAEEEKAAAEDAAAAEGTKEEGAANEDPAANGGDTE